MRITVRELRRSIRESIANAMAEAKFDPKILIKKRGFFFTLRDALNYVENQGLLVLGEGSARKVFAVDSKRALKMAINQKGIAQNKAEMQLIADPAGGGLFAKIFDHDPKFEWLLSELVRPLTDEKEFQQLTGVPWGVFYSFVLDKNGDYDKIMSRYQQYGFQRWNVISPEDMQEILKKPFLLMTLKTLKTIKEPLVEDDLAKLDHWGKTPDQRVVLLDYGFTEEVWDSHYKSK